HHAAGSDDCVAADPDAIEDLCPRSYPDVVVDTYSLCRDPRQIQRIDVAAGVVIGRNDDRMCSNANAVADLHATMPINNRERIDAAVIANANAPSVGQNHGERVYFAMSPDID